MKTYNVIIDQHELDVMSDTVVYMRAMAQTLGGDKEALTIKLKTYAQTIEDWVERVEVTAVST